MRTNNEIHEVTAAVTEILSNEFEDVELSSDLIERIRSAITECLNTRLKAYLTPPEFAAELGVSPDKVLGWIRSGELRASNLATTQSGRPRYRIDREAITEFKNKRANHSPPPKPQRRQRKPADVIEFF